MNDRVLVVGAGFAGSVVARELADHGHKVLVIDKREHLAGNAYDCYDEKGVLVHRYGPHIFHTNSERIVRWLSRFTAWRFYEHRVLAEVDAVLYPIPVNRQTINSLYGLNLSEEETQQFLEKVRIDKPVIQTSEDVVLASVGADLCDKFSGAIPASNGGWNLPSCLREWLRVFRCGRIVMTAILRIRTSLCPWMGIPACLNVSWRIRI